MMNAGGCPELLVAASDFGSKPAASRIEARIFFRIFMFVFFFLSRVIVDLP